MLTENDALYTFKAPCCCFENAPNTDLLFFRQSMGVLIVGGIKYTISFWRKIYSIESKHNVLLCFLLKKKLCAEKVISLCLFVYKLQDLKDSSLETFLLFPSCRNLNCLSLFKCIFLFNLLNIQCRFVRKNQWLHSIV